jgi:hypothetical protein
VKGDRVDGETVTATSAEVEEHPFPSVKVILNIPEAATTIVGVVDKSVHIMLEVAEEVNETLVPEQNVVGPFAEIVGIGGSGKNETVILVHEVLLHDPV